MARNAVAVNLLLRPLSVLYGGIVRLRNLMFKWGILKEQTFPVPVISIGNLAAGGTGKTPHTEMVVEMMRRNHNVAVLSRGYKRSTKGFILATRRSSPQDIGDEPYQIFHKFDAKIPVAVCESRVKGINELLRLNPSINLIVLDDAFQHRYVKPTVSILLTEFDRPAYNDHLLPYGDLREPFSSINRADIVVVTKCPVEMKPIEVRLHKGNLNLMPYQSLFFSTFSYQPLKPVFPDDVEEDDFFRLERLNKEDSLLALSGIANPKPFVRWLKKSPATVKSKSFPDHHNFQRKDLELIKRLYYALPGEGRKYIVTTEKDAVRIANNPYFPPELKKFIFYQPIAVKIVSADDSLSGRIERKIREANIGMQR